MSGFLSDTSSTLKALQRMIEVSAEQQVRFMSEFAHKSATVVGVPTMAGPTTGGTVSTEGDGSAAWDTWAGKKLGSSGAGVSGVGGAETFSGGAVHGWGRRHSWI